MKITLKEVTVGELVEGYADDGEGGVQGYAGNLDIRPPFQREFVYKDKQRDAVIETINDGFPLNVMYWSLREDGTYEVIDGQQRTIAIAQYVAGDFSVGGLGFFNLQDDQQQRILDYQLQVYVCEGTASEKLAWFRTINIEGERLTNQELRNAVYAGTWVSNAKQHFSRSGAACPAYAIGSQYVNRRANRQEYLETAIQWIKSESQTIEDYMAGHQHDKTATALWNHFQSVINRVEAVFPNYRKQMKGVDWGGLYPYLQNENLDPEQIEMEVSRLMKDDDVTKKSGIYSYVLTNQERDLNIRAFTDSMKTSAYERQEGVCNICKEKFDLADMHADHKLAWSLGGPTSSENCQVLCRSCNLEKSNS